MNAPDIDVFVADEQRDRDVDGAWLARLAKAVLADEGVRNDAELSVILVDEPTMAGHNEQFLGHDGPTDVLSFPIEDEPLGSGRMPDGGTTGPGAAEPEAPLLLGDVIICPEVAFRNAPQHAGTFEDELALLLIHGILHLLGMDHEEHDEAEEMEARERDLMARHARDRPENAGDRD